MNESRCDSTGASNEKLDFFVPTMPEIVTVLCTAAPVEAASKHLMVVCDAHEVSEHKSVPILAVGDAYELAKLTPNMETYTDALVGVL